MFFSSASVADVSDLKVSAARAKEIQLVVESQLAAFAADDAERAFAIAAPSIQQIYGNADQFMLMVRRSYPVVYRPASVVFFMPEPEGNAISQPVAMTDADGKAWTAVYRLEQGKDKLWRIAGCVLFLTNPKNLV